MAWTPEEDDFWERVEHDMRVRTPWTWGISMLMLRLGMLLVLLSVGYLVFFFVLKPPSGYFLWSGEMSLHPMIWALLGVLLIISGAYLRFRVMGGIIDRLKSGEAG